MAWFLFIDESGQDHHDSPYEVLAGVAIKDEVLWKLVRELHDAELARFGRRYSSGVRELKGKKILKTKVFQHARLSPTILPHEVPALSKACLDNGEENSDVRYLKALALAKIGYVTDLFAVCGSYGCKVLASVVETDAPQSSSAGLRKDYAYLFQRFFYLLEDDSHECGHSQQGIIVFDELEKSRSHILIDQSHKYFNETATGRARASLIIPEPLFVHSDLTTGVQIADLVAYVISWGFRIPHVMTKPLRLELGPYASQIASLRFRTSRSTRGKHYDIWGISHISDLRTKLERLDDIE